MCDVEHRAIHFGRVEQRQDMRMLGIGGRFNFLHESALKRRLGATRRVLKDTEWRLSRRVDQKHCRHDASAESALDGIAIRECGREPGGDIGHGAARCSGQAQMASTGRAVTRAGFQGARAACVTAAFSWSARTSFM